MSAAEAAFRDVFSDSPMTEGLASESAPFFF